MSRMTELASMPRHTPCVQACPLHLLSSTCPLTLLLLCSAEEVEEPVPPSRHSPMIGRREKDRTHHQDEVIKESPRESTDAVSTTFKCSAPLPHSQVQCDTCALSLPLCMQGPQCADQGQGAAPGPWPSPQHPRRGAQTCCQYVGQAPWRSGGASRTGCKHRWQCLQPPRAGSSCPGARRCCARRDTATGH
jgi:hypothetical protein